MKATIRAAPSGSIRSAMSTRTRPRTETGSVVGKRDEDGRKVVDLKMTMINQGAVETSFADVTVCLPSRDTGQALLPAVPEDIQR